MVVAAAAATCLRLFQVAETTPRHSDIVGIALVVKVAVATVLKVAVVHPGIGYPVKTEQVPTVAVVCAGTHQRQVAQNQILRPFLEI